MRRRSKFSTNNPFSRIGYRNFLYDGEGSGEGNDPGGGSGGPNGAGPTGSIAPTGFQIADHNVWNPPAPIGPTGTPVAPAAPVAATPAQTPSETAMAQFDTRVAGLQFDAFTPTDEQTAAIFDNRDLSALNDFMHTGFRSVYKSAMIDAVRMMNTMQTNIMKNVRTEAQSVTDQNSNINALRAALPFTANPNMAPIADAALQTQLGAGKNIDEAISIVRAFFEQSAQISSKDLGLNLPPSGEPGTGNFRQGAEGEEIDWTKLLGGG